MMGIIFNNHDIVYMMNLDMIGHYDNDHYANVYHGPEKGYSELWCRLAERYVDINGFLGGSTASDHLPRSYRKETSLRFTTLLRTVPLI